MSTVEFHNVDAEGAVLFNSKLQSGFGISGRMFRLLQTVLPNLAEAKSLGEMSFNAQLDQFPLALMLGMVEKVEMFTTDFTAYSLGFLEDDGEQVEYALFVADYEGNRYIAFAPLADAYEFTSDKCPNGGFEPQAIPLDEWDEFVKEFVAVEIPEA